MSKIKSTNKSKHGAAVLTETALLTKIARSLELVVALTVQSVKGDRTQKDMIKFLDALGCGQTEIANLLGTNQNVVNVTLNRAKRKAGKK